MKTTILIIVGIALMALAGLAFAAFDHRGAWHDDDPSWQTARQHRINWVKARLAEKLELTESQQAELDRMITELKTKRDQMRAQRPEMKAKFIDALRRDHLEGDDLLSLIDAKRPEFEELLTMAADRIAEFHNMLTPEQRAKLISELESHSGRCPFGH